MQRTIPAFLFACATAAQNPCANEWMRGEPFPGLFGTAYASCWWDPDGAGPAPRQLVVAGGFASAFSALANNIAMWDPTTDVWTPLGAGTNGQVNALVVMPNNDLVVGGVFTLAGGQPASYIARWDGNNWSTIGSGVDNVVMTLLVLANGDLVAGGSFDHAGGVAAPAIARWDGVAWSAIGQPFQRGTGAYVDDLAQLPNGNIVAGGYFEFFVGPLAYLQQWDGIAWTDLGGGVDNAVTSMLTMPNGDLVVSGMFPHAGTITANGVARWDGATWNSMGGLGEARALTLLANGDLFAGGKFYFAGGQPALRVATWDGTSWHALGQGLQYWVETVSELPNGDLFAGGGGSSTSGEFYGLGRFDGTQWAPFGAGKGIPQPATAVTAAPDGSWIVGGYFTTVRGVSMSHIARYDDGSDTWSPIGTGLGGLPNALHMTQSGDLVAAGDFTVAGGTNAAHVARWDGTAWSALGQGLDDRAWAIAELPNGDLLVGGDFLDAGGAFLPFLARWDGTSWHGLASGQYWTNWYVRALAVMPNGDIVAGGGFTVAGNTSAQRIARWNGSTWSPLGAGMDQWVHALLVLPNGDLIAGGAFTLAGGQAANHIARWNGSTWSPLGQGLNSTVDSLELLPNGDIVAGGGFNIAGGAPAHQLARWNGTTWTAIAGDVMTGGSVYDLAVRSTGELAAVGAIAANEAYTFLRLATECPAVADTLPTTCVGTAGPVTLTASGLPWTGSTLHTRATGLAPGALAVALVGLGSPNVPLSWLWPNTGAGCNQLASQEAILLVLPQAGAAGFQLALPNSPAFAGLQLFHQFLQFEVDNQNNLGALSASNGLRLVIGSY